MRVWICTLWVSPYDHWLPTCCIGVVCAFELKLDRKASSAWWQHVLVPPCVYLWLQSTFKHFYLFFSKGKGTVLPKVGFPGGEMMYLVLCMSILAAQLLHCVCKSSLPLLLGSQSVLSVCLYPSRQSYCSKYSQSTPVGYHGPGSTSSSEMESL